MVGDTGLRHVWWWEIQGYAMSDYLFPQVPAKKADQTKEKEYVRGRFLSNLYGSV